MSNHQGYGFNSSLPSSDSFSYMLTSSPSSTPYSSGPTAPSFGFQDDVQRLDLATLMKNPHIQELFNRCNSASATLIETIQQNNRLMQENLALRTNNSHVGHGLPTGGRPAQYPESILWLESDCVNDPDIVFSPSNPSRLPMASAIRHADGNIVESGLYEAIHATGNMIIHRDLFTLPPAPDKRASTAARTKTYYKQWFRPQWIAALAEYEREQPLLKHCVASWKADKLLGSILAAASQSLRNAQLAQAKASESDNSHSSTATGNHSPEILDGGSALKRPQSPSTAPTSIPKKTKLLNPIVITNKSLVSLSGFSGTPTLEKLSSDSTAVDVDFIVVSSSIHDLQEMFCEEYPKMAAAKDLLDTMKMYPDFGRQDPSADMTEFLQRIENAEPNDSSLDEDNLGAGWGHYQFTAGSLTCSSVITTWAAVGNTDIACRLIAASVRTAKVARYWCHANNITASSFVSDMYVDRVIESLWKAWKATPGACTVTTTSALKKDTVSEVAETNPLNAVVPVPAEETDQVEDGPGKVVSMTQSIGDSEILKAFQNKELRAWLAQHNIRLEGPLNKQRTNKELVSAILDNPDCPNPTQEDLKTILAARPTKKKKTLL